MTQRKAVEEFDQALLGPTSLGPAQPETRAMAALAHRFGQTAQALPGIDETFRVTLRERLVREASLVGAAVPAQRGRHAGRSGSRSGSRAPGRGAPVNQGSVWRRRLLAAGIGVAVATGSVGGIAIASANALPGDPLYNTKKMFENLQLSMSGSPTDQGRQYLKLADTRLNEIDDLLGRPDVDVPGSPTGQYLAQTLNELQSMISNGGQLLLSQVHADDDQTAVHTLSDFLQTERQRVLDLVWQLPVTLQGRPAQIVAVMDDLTRQLEQDQSQFPPPGQPGSGPTGSGGPGAQQSSPRPGGSPAPGGSASPYPSGSASPTPSGTTGATGGATAGSTPGDNPTIGLYLPLPILPPTGINLPPLLPGLPGIDLGLGDPPTDSPQQ